MCTQVASGKQVERTSVKKMCIVPRGHKTGAIWYSWRFSEIIQEEDRLKGTGAQGAALPTDGSLYSFSADVVSFIFIDLISHSSKICCDSKGEAGVISSSSKKLAAIGICSLYSSGLCMWARLVTCCPLCTAAQPAAGESQVSRLAQSRLQSQRQEWSLLGLCFWKAILSLQQRCPLGHPPNFPLVC